MLSIAKGVLFDLDGTLLDTADDLGASLNYLMGKYGFEQVSANQYRMVASDGVYPLLDLGFKDELVHFDKEKLRSEFLNYYLNNIAQHTLLFDGVEQLIVEIENANLPWGIVTNKPAFLTDPLLCHFKEFSNSITNISGDTLPYSKPHPAPMLLASEHLNVAPENIWYFGDAKRDIDAGNAVNMTSVIAKWGYIKDLKDCQNWHADYLINSPLEILKVSNCTTSANNNQNS